MDILKNIRELESRAKNLLLSGNIAGAEILKTTEEILTLLEKRKKIKQDLEVVDGELCERVIYLKRLAVDITSKKEPQKKMS